MAEEAKIVIGDKEFNLDEARAVYEALRKIFYDGSIVYGECHLSKDPDVVCLSGHEQLRIEANNEIYLSGYGRGYGHPKSIG